MIKIGDFSRIGGVTVATLRHYDEAGLLKPSLVVEATGYRYYRIEQLPRLNRIIVFKELGFTLSEIEYLLRDKPDAAEIRELLRQKRAESEKRMTEEFAKLQRIERRIQIIEKENTMQELEIVVKTAPAMTIATNRVHVPTNDQVPDLLDKAYGTVCKFIQQNNLTQKGPCLAIWYSSPNDFTDEEVDAAIPIEKVISGEGDVKVQQIPATEVASVVHSGPFEEFQECHRSLVQWLENSDYEVVGPYREIYHENGDGDATTEVQYPIALKN